MIHGRIPPLSGSPTATTVTQTTVTMTDELTPDAIEDVEGSAQDRQNPAEHPLTNRQKRFVEAYLIDPNATKAAIEAGYSKHSAARRGVELRNKPHIARAIAEAQAERAERTRVTADYVVTSLKEVVERCLTRAPVLEWDKETRRLKQKTDENGNSVWQFDSVGANRALELLGKHLGMFAQEKTTNVTLQLQGVARAIIAAATPPALPSSDTPSDAVDAEFVADQSPES